MPDLREWLEQVRQLGKLKEIRGASWDLEIGALTDQIFESSTATNR